MNANNKLPSSIQTHPVRYVLYQCFIANSKCACCMSEKKCKEVVFTLCVCITILALLEQVFTHTKRVKSNPLRQTNYVVHKKVFCPTCITNLV